MNAAVNFKDLLELEIGSTNLAGETKAEHDDVPSQLPASAGQAFPSESALWKTALQLAAVQKLSLPYPSRLQLS